MEMFAQRSRSELASAGKALIAQGRDVIDLSMFNPDLAPPRYAVDKLLEASVKSSNHRYGVARGIRKLREAFALKYQRAFGVSLDPESQVCVSLGSKDALERALICLKEAGFGPSILLGTPSYPGHLIAARLCGLQPCYFPLNHQQDGMLESLQALLKAHPGSIVLLNFPNNPSGNAVTASFYDALLPAVVRSGSFVINDFVYGEMGPQGQPFPSLLSSAQAHDPCAETYSLSKAYSLAGWRVAALCGQKQLVSAVAALKSLADYGLFLPLQMAASATLNSELDLVQESVRVYARRCEVLAQGLLQLGWELSSPAAGACLWARLPACFRAEADASAACVGFCRDFLRKSAVSTLPGKEFGQEWSEYVRFACVVPEERIREVLERLAAFQRK